MAYACVAVAPPAIVLSSKFHVNVRFWPLEPTESKFMVSPVWAVVLLAVITATGGWLICEVIVIVFVSVSLTPQLSVTVSNEV